MTKNSPLWWVRSNWLLDRAAQRLRTRRPPGCPGQPSASHCGNLFERSSAGELGGDLLPLAGGARSLPAAPPPWPTRQRWSRPRCGPVRRRRRPHGRLAAPRSGPVPRLAGSRSCSASSVSTLSGRPRSTSLGRRPAARAWPRPPRPVRSAAAVCAQPVRVSQPATRSVVSSVGGDSARDRVPGGATAPGGRRRPAPAHRWYVRGRVPLLTCGPRRAACGRSATRGGEPVGLGEQSRQRRPRRARRRAASSSSASRPSR